MTLGCYQDYSVRAIPTLEGKESILDGNYWTRTDAINKCYKAAKKRGYKVFALQDGGWCASSATAENTFNRYAQSSNCKADGEGGPYANQVYLIKGKDFNIIILRNLQIWFVIWFDLSDYQLLVMEQVKFDSYADSDN